ncbi:MAG TPA: endonuclease III [Thermoanaerobaculia bacterium]|jgi:endonuclease-3|nr:endonuclease III [Thermoanaerobaculia bacterium]
MKAEKKSAPKPLKAARMGPRPPGITPGQARRESGRARRERVAEIVARLHREDPNPRIALDFETPLQLLVATILAAQSTDVQINKVTPALFRRYPTAHDFAGADLAELEELVKTTGFFHNKARAVNNLGKALVADHDGEVPARMEDLVALPGVGRKTANVILGNAFSLNAGIIVDTHVTRLSRRLGLTEENDPVKIEQNLIAVVPQEQWTLFALLLINHGRRTCKAKKPECGHCPVADLCPSAEV